MAAESRAKNVLPTAQRSRYLAHAEFERVGEPTVERTDPGDIYDIAIGPATPVISQPDSDGTAS